jgi:hypothetical protein
MTHDELVERVARAIMSPKADPSDWRFWTDEARIAISVVLEEAAKVIDEMPLSYPGNAAETALECAEAIRKLKGEA